MIPVFAQKLNLAFNQFFNRLINGLTNLNYVQDIGPDPFTLGKQSPGNDIVVAFNR